MHENCDSKTHLAKQWLTSSLIGEKVGITDTRWIITGILQYAIDSGLFVVKGFSFRLDDIVSIKANRAGIPIFVIRA